jgi:hypothetical protein
MTSIDQLVSITREMSLYVWMFMSTEGQVTNSELSGSKRYSKSSAFGFVLDINLILLHPAPFILHCCTFERFVIHLSLQWNLQTECVCVCVCVCSCTKRSTRHRKQSPQFLTMMCRRVIDCTIFFWHYPSRCV